MEWDLDHKLSFGKEVQLLFTRQLDVGDIAEIKIFILTVFSYPEGCLWTAYPDFLLQFFRPERYPHLPVFFMLAGSKMCISFRSGLNYARSRVNSNVALDGFWN